MSPIRPIYLKVEGRTPRWFRVKPFDKLPETIQTRLVPPGNYEGINKYLKWHYEQNEFSVFPKTELKYSYVDRNSLLKSLREGGIPEWLIMRKDDAGTPENAARVIIGRLCNLRNPDVYEPVKSESEIMLDAKSEGKDIKTLAEYLRAIAYSFGHGKYSEDRHEWEEFPSDFIIAQSGVLFKDDFLSRFLFLKVFGLSEGNITKASGLSMDDIIYNMILPQAGIKENLIESIKYLDEVAKILGMSSRLLLAMFINQDLGKTEPYRSDMKATRDAIASGDTRVADAIWRELSRDGH